MDKNALPYLEYLKNGVKRAISDQLSADQVGPAAVQAIAFHFGDTGSKAFQVYYRKVTGNQTEFLRSTAFFRHFKSKYSLQGIDGGYLDRLEASKDSILRLINDDHLAELYAAYFANVELKHGAGTSRKNLGSFFAKLVHTFKPDMYCALDNPIKDALGLKNESFYIAFLVVSAAYREWARDNPGLMRRIRAELERNETGRAYSPAMTDLKLLDLVFWHRANRPA